MQAWSIRANNLRLDGGAMFGVVPKAMWSGWYAADELNRITISCNCLAVRTGAGVVLLEAGIDFFMDPTYSDRYGVEGEPGCLVTELAKAGIAEDEVTHVVLSHLHFDHLGGLLPEWPKMQEPDWDLRFPRVRYVAGRRQFECAKNPHYRDRASFIPGIPEKLEASGRLALVDDDDPQVRDLDERFSFRFSDGHTPGMLQTLVTGDKETILFVSDILPGTHWVHLPVVSGYDRFPERSVDEKKAVLDTALAENWLIFYPHDPQVCASRITKNEKGRYEAVGEVKNMDGLTL